jgi:NAD(P)-dependent dehydrogenase (short-subunit alcohol dehydrogenase family)
MDIRNASAIVSGGAGGFGSATVRRLARMGAKVVIADVSDERGEERAREIRTGSLYVPTDCANEDAIATAVKAAAGLGLLHAAVINHIGPDWPGGRRPARNAGRRRGSTLAKERALTWNQRGVIINTASIVGFEGQPGQAAYSAANGGIIGMRGERGADAYDSLSAQRALESETCAVRLMRHSNLLRNRMTWGTTSSPLTQISTWLCAGKDTNVASGISSAACFIAG